jgi:UDP-N-acetylmuramate dehydrogenase
MTTQPLRELTTIGVGGEPAGILAPQSRAELIEAAKTLWSSGEDWLILGGGSNMVVADEVPNLHVLKVETKGIEVLAPGQIRVEAGENWDELVAFTVQHAWSGLESLSGIPGTVGAAPIQNIGAYGQEVSQVIERLEFLDYETHELVVLEAADCGFGYRDSSFKRGRAGLVTWVEFRLLVDLPAGSHELMRRRRAEVLATRASKGMVLDSSDRDTFSCGSFFTNPIVSDRFARTLPSEAPRWDIAEDDGATVKLSAAWLIENAGLRKGFALAGSHAALSTKHALAITNRGGATAEEVVQLARYIQDRVANQWGVTLVPEPNLIGF